MLIPLPSTDYPLPLMGLTLAAIASLLMGVAVPVTAAESAAAQEGRICGFRLLQLMVAQAAAGQDPGAAAAKILSPADVGEAAQELPPITVGTQLEFHVSFSLGQVPATCRFVGEHVFVFVENKQWDTEGGSIFQSHVDGLGELFDRHTPADPDRGIFELATETFGEPSDVDGYEQIFILVLNIPFPTVGYFDPAVANHAVPELRRDVLYLDEFRVRRESYLARGTLAHEFQHLIHWGHDSDEDAWVNEGLSGYAEELVGYQEADPTAVPRFLERPDRTGVGLDIWQNAAYNYGSTFLFMSFLAERYGSDLIRQVVAEPRNGRHGIDSAFSRLSLGEDFAGAWQEWVVANYAVGDEAFAYAALSGRRVMTFPIARLPLAPIGGQVGFRWGTANVLFRTPGAVHIDIDGDDATRFRWLSYAMRRGLGTLEEIHLDELSRGQVTATDIDSLTLIVGRTSLQGNGKFQISARQPVATAVASVEPPDPSGTGLRLQAGFPNPFNGVVHIPFLLDGPATVEMRVYDSVGQQVLARHLGRLSSGRQEAVWDGRSGAGAIAGSGRYLVLLKAGDIVRTASLTLIR